ncbi:hypothetical protein C8Q74DRAFT_117018 [Fomes fomentarius]|nr:hypothetical protein C8Q74DRAFT_117018 [Fomes fomentarius]
MSGLFPGYRQVEAFGPDDEYEPQDGEIEEEVEYVTLDLGTVEPTLVPSSSSYRLVGLDTPTPFLQLSGTMLKGQHVSLLGTELLFAESTDEIHDRGKKPLVHVANTERRIRFKEVELRPKSSGDTAPTDNQPGSAAAKSSSAAQKAKTQIDHVMSGSAGASRRGRGGKKRGSSKAKLKGKGRAENPTAEPDEEQPRSDSGEAPHDGAAQMDVDTSAG